MWAAAPRCPSRPFPAERRACNGTDLAENLAKKREREKKKCLRQQRRHRHTSLRSGEMPAAAAMLPAPLGRACGHLYLSPNRSQAYLQELHSCYCTSCGEIIITKSLNQTESFFCSPLNLFPPPTLSTLQLFLSFLREVIRVSLEVGELWALPAFATYISYYCCASKAGWTSESTGPSHSLQFKLWECCQNKV